MYTYAPYYYRYVTNCCWQQLVAIYTQICKNNSMILYEYKYILYSIKI